MVKSFYLNLIILIIFSFFVASFSQPSHNLITPCLTNHHNTNFSTFPTSQNGFNESSYYHYLIYSLRNLRFSTPKIPKPNVIILPKSKEQLVSSLLCSKKAGYEVRIRSGGHSYEGISSVSNDGKPFVIIDMMNLDQVVVDLKSETAWVEGGATVGQVYYTIADQSKGAYGFSAGSVPTLGIGGHILGGGFGLLSRKYGLAADNVVDAVLVGPDGQVLDRADMGEDVFWALLGVGGGSFGIVYAWKIKLLKVPPKVTACQVSRNGQIENMSQLVHKWQDVGPYLNDLFYMSIFLQANNESDISATFMTQYLGERTNAINIIQNKFPKLRIKKEECKEMKWIESVLYFSGLSDESTIKDLTNRSPQNKNCFKAKSDYVTQTIPLEGVQGGMDVLAKEPKGYIIMDPYGGKISRIANDSIAFPHRKGNLFSIQYMVSWTKEEEMNKDSYITWIRGFYEFMTPYVSSNPRAAYVNYLDLDLGRIKYRGGGGSYEGVEEGRVWGEKYFLKNYERLVKVKTMFDPCNFFRYTQGIPPMPNKLCHIY